MICDPDCVEFLYKLLSGHCAVSVSVTRRVGQLSPASEPAWVSFCPHRHPSCYQSLDNTTRTIQASTRRELTCQCTYLASKIHISQELERIVMV